MNVCLLLYRYGAMTETLHTTLLVGTCWSIGRSAAAQDGCLVCGECGTSLGARHSPLGTRGTPRDCRRDTRPLRPRVHVCVLSMWCIVCVRGMCRRGRQLKWMTFVAAALTASYLPAPAVPRPQPFVPLCSPPTPTNLSRSVTLPLFLSCRCLLEPRFFDESAVRAMLSARLTLTVHVCFYVLC